uniref:Uncharacterized protein n=1 Tax=Sander lucioperca TaxID=283035 RepID=A0A8C9Y656_SANLU
MINKKLGDLRPPLKFLKWCSVIYNFEKYCMEHNAQAEFTSDIQTNDPIHLQTTMKNLDINSLTTPFLIRL